MSLTKEESSMVLGGMGRFAFVRQILGPEP